MPITTIKEARPYFVGLLKELKFDCHKKPAFSFLCCAAFIEYLAKLETLPTERRDWFPYMHFIETRMPTVYKDFSYVNLHISRKSNSTADVQIKDDLPLQMYCVLRCGLVHSFSMTPNPKYTISSPRNPGKHARQRSIVLSHNDPMKPATTYEKHLSNFTKDSLDAACLVLQYFIDDIETAANALFDDAQFDPALKILIEKNLTDVPPLAEL